MVAKAKKKIKLELAEDGKSYSIDTEEEAALAIDKAAQAYTKIDEITAEHGLKDLVEEIELIRQGLADFQATTEFKELEHAGWKSILIERTKSIWLWTIKDLPELKHASKDEPVTPLYDIIKKKFRKKEKRLEVINMVTKRVVDSAGLDMAVREGIFTAEEIKDARYQYIDATYVQVKPD